MSADRKGSPEDAKTTTSGRLVRAGKQKFNLPTSVSGSRRRLMCTRAPRTLVSGLAKLWKLG
jgi:hypothetical protein